MRDKATNTTRLDVVGNGPKSESEIFSSVLKQWRQRLGYCSLFAAIPAILASPLAEARPDSAKKSEASVAEKPIRPERQSLTLGNHALLKRQSAFRLPHQAQKSVTLAQNSGPDDCPGGQTIPGATYTAAAPYVVSGDTTGANNTVTRVYDINYRYYNYEVSAPDHVYSFTLTARGQDPQIKVSTTSGTYKPVIYILQGDVGERCPSGTDNQVFNELVLFDSRWSNGNTATLENWAVNYLPLNVPLYLFIDSGANDGNGSGPYTLQMQDITIASSTTSCAGPNPIDCPEKFVRQHYLDFLNREPEANGLAAWLAVLNACPANDQFCQHQQRLTTSGGFFGSIEFHIKGYFAFRFYRVAFDRLPEFSEIGPDMQNVTGQTPTEVYTKKAAFTDSFVQRPEFAVFYGGKSNSEYVDALLLRYGVASITSPDPAQPDGAVKVTLTRDQLVSQLDAATLTRAQVLRAIADSNEIFNKEYNRAFVAMQYYGYLRRTPEPAGYFDWLDYLDTHPGDFREMVRGFVDSTEYRARFGQP